MVGFTSDFIGPLGSGSHFVVAIAPQASETHIVYQTTLPTTTVTGSVEIQHPQPTETVVQSDVYAFQGFDSVRVMVELRDGAEAVLDSGAVTSIWATTDGLGRLVGSTSVGGAFTESDRTLLQTVANALQVTIGTATGDVTHSLAELFSRSTLDRLTLQEITSGPTSEPVRATVVGAFTGVIVRVTTIDPALIPITPDAEWFRPDLAVLRVFRGTDLVYRRGIHTPTFFAPHPWHWNDPVFDSSLFFGVPPETGVYVDFRVNCAGQVFLAVLP